MAKKILMRAASIFGWKRNSDLCKLNKKNKIVLVILVLNCYYIKGHFKVPVRSGFIG